jgi:acetate kinase
MGFTPLDGLMMGTRSGSVDPGILTYLLRADRTDGAALDETLNTKSGLLGISGISGDMREIAAAMKTETNALSWRSTCSCTGCGPVSVRCWPQ